jgi:hypothetical protein
MNMKIREIAGSILAVGLLIFYVLVVWQMISEVKDWIHGNDPISFSGGKYWIVNAIGGLISAVVITTLGISKPGGAPIGSVRELSRALGEVLMGIVTIMYITIWVILGCFVIYYGVIESPEASATLNEMGKAWFGLFIGAVYAYLGINQKA